MARGRINGAPNETQTHLWRFASFVGSFYNNPPLFIETVLSILTFLQTGNIPIIENKITILKSKLDFSQSKVNILTNKSK